MLVEDLRTLVVFERKVLRTIYDGVKMEDGTYRRSCWETTHRPHYKNLVTTVV